MNKIEEKRKEKEWTRRKLEDESGISYYTIYLIERKNHKVKSYVLKAIASALEIPFDEVKDMVK